MRGRRRWLRSRLRLRLRLRSWIIAARRIPARSSKICKREPMSSSGAKASAIRNTHYATRNPALVSLPLPVLAIWTAPPGPAELRAALERVKPQTVYLFGVDPGYGSPSAFLGRLAGLVKHALSARDGGARISELAAATAAREATVRAGLTWLAARGSIDLTFGDGDEVRLSSGDGAVRPDLAQATSRLEALLAETAAYRAYLCQRQIRDRAARVDVHRRRTTAPPTAHRHCPYLSLSVSIKEVSPCVSASWQCRSAR